MFSIEKEMKEQVGHVLAWLTDYGWTRPTMFFC